VGRAGASQRWGRKAAPDEADQYGELVDCLEAQLKFIGSRLPRGGKVFLL
jgi:hypothetical protein